METKYRISMNGQEVTGTFEDFIDMLHKEPPEAVQEAMKASLEAKGKVDMQRPDGSNCFSISHTFH